MIRPVKVLGFPRSGTSLLQRLFASHPQIYCPPETYVFSGCARMIRESSGEGPNLGMVTGLSFAGFDEGDILARVRSFGFSFLDEAAAKAGKQSWLEKSAFDIFDLTEIEEIFTGHCRFICVVRNPLDVISSMKELTDQMGQNVPELAHWMLRHENYYLAWASAWRDLTDRLLAFHERLGGDSLLYRYEDLTADPGKELRRISDFLELEPFDQVPAPEQGQIGLGDWKVLGTRNVVSGSVARWRKSLPKSSARQALPILEPMMQRLGYAVPKIAAPLSRKDRVVQFQRAKHLARAVLDRGTES